MTKKVYFRNKETFCLVIIKNISFVNGREVPWEKQILDAYCVITYTSGLAIDAIVRGIPVIACDEGNFAWNVAERKLRNIESLNLAKRRTSKSMA